MSEDKLLVQRILENQPQALEELVRLYQRPIYGFVWRLVASHEDAADITQQVFMRAHRQIKYFRQQCKLHTWLYQIAQNLCRSHWRKFKHYTPVSLDEAAEEISLIDFQTPESLAQVKQQQILVRQAVDRLPYKQRITLTLRVYEQMSYQEIGQVLGCSETAAKVNYQHAFNQLKAALRGLK